MIIDLPFLDSYSLFIDILLGITQSINSDVYADIFFLRKDLGNSKRKEVLEKLEQSLEDQTFSIFKHYKLLSSGGEKRVHYYSHG